MEYGMKGSQNWNKPRRQYTLKFDFWLITVLVLFACLSISYAVTWPDLEALGAFTDSYMDLTLLSVTILSIFTGPCLKDHQSGRRFWVLIALAFSIWFMLRMINIKEIVLLHSVFGDIVYFLFYLTCLLAIESQVGSPGASGFARVRYWLTLSSNVLFTIGVVGYFVIIPSIFDPQTFDKWLPSFYCYIALDIYLAFRFFTTAQVIPPGRWRAILRLFGLAALGWLVADRVEMQGFISDEVLASGGIKDLIWVFPYLPPIIASRLVDISPLASREANSEYGKRKGSYDRLFLIAVFVLPIIHVVGYPLGWFQQSSYVYRGLFLLIWLLVMGALLSVLYTMLYRRNRMLENLRLRNVRILEAISKVQSHYIAATDSPSVFENMLEQLLVLTDSEYGFVGEIRHGHEGEPYLKTLAMAYVNTSNDGQRFFGQRGGAEIHDLDTLFGAAVTTGSPVIANDPANYPRRGGFPSGTPEPHAFLGIPLYHREKLIGMFGIANRSKGYDSQILKYLEPFSTTCGGILSAYHGERERKHMSELASRFGRILDDSLQEIYLFDAETLHFMQVNRGARENVGYTDEELRQLTPEDIYPETGTRFRNILQPLLDGEEDKVQYTTTHLRKDGTTYPVDVYLQKASFGERPVMVAIALDITERKRMEKEKARLEAQVIQSQKLETIGTLAGGIAHDFNNILAPIIWYTEMIVNDDDNDEEIREDLRHVLKAANRAKDLVQQILTFGRLGEAERSSVQIQLVIDEAIKLLRASLPATIEIKKEVDTKADPVLADHTQVHQVVMNLCTNAYHAMRQSGGILKVGLCIKHFEEEDLELGTTLKPGRWVELTVSDTGHGMDPTTMDRIFEPFFTTKRVDEGTGLGLSVIHGIVMTHGGHIQVNSKPGAGTTFSVYLPPINYDMEISDKHEVVLAEGNERILFVDDEDEIVRTGKLMLERFGYHVTATTSSMQALSIFRERPEDFDLVITDQTMPQITGMRLAEEMHTVRDDVPIVLSTGFSEEAAEERWKEAGICRLVMKPVVGRDLHRIIRSILDAQES